MSRLRSDERGVVYVEVLSVFVLLLLLFFGTWQIAELAAARLVVRRAAAAAARAAAVVLPDDPKYYGQSRRLQDFQVHLAAAMILRAAPQTRLGEVRVSLEDIRDGERIVRVEVEARFQCGLRIACLPDGERTLLQSSTRAYQGARYEYGG